jgi:hypothetical protein
MELIHDWSNCHCVGIRVLNTYGNVPFESYIGYSKKFWDSENWLSMQEDQCACIRVIQGKPEPQDLPAITPGGSFRLNNANEFFSASGRRMGDSGVYVCSGLNLLLLFQFVYQEIDWGYPRR